jgi:anti-sigma B factor antagonist
MNDITLTMGHRQLTPTVSVLDISGDVTGASEQALTDAYAGVGDGVRTVLLNFSDLSYMNSSGIGLLVMLLVRTRRRGQSLAACGLSDHYRQIFELCRLDDAIAIHTSESDAIAAGKGERTST